MKKYRRKTREKLHPLMTYIILIALVIIFSSFFNLLDVGSNFLAINSATLEVNPVSEVVESMLNLEGLKYIFTNTVNNFANFSVLSNIIIVLMGIGIMDKSGFLQTVITLTTKRLKKKSVTFIFVLLCILSSIIGELAYLIMIPLGALLFFYGKRNPSIGIISGFAALSCGNALNVFFTSSDSALVNYTELAAHTVNSSYNISNLAFVFIMLVAVLVVAYVITNVTENSLVLKLSKYEFTETELEEDIVTKSEKRGMLYAIFAGLIYLLFFVYNIIPGLPLSGAFLDYGEINYIDKLFSPNSFFSNGFVFIITMLFIILGLFYGIGSKSIKNQKEFSDSLGHSLDGIGNVLVMIFFASMFISIFEKTNIGNTIIAFISNVISTSSFSGFAFIILVFLLIAIGTLFLPSSTLKWQMLSATIVPLMMGMGITPEFSQIIFRFAETSMLNITPIFVYFIVYLAFLEKYNQGEKKIQLFESIKYQIPYSIIIMLTLLAIILVWYIIGLPLGFNAFPTI